MSNRLAGLIPTVVLLFAAACGAGTELSIDDEIAAPPADELDTEMSALTTISNPLGFAYNTSAGVTAYAHPTGMVVTGRCNRYDAAFKTVRAAGGEVLAYLNPIDNVVACPEDAKFLGPRVNWSPYRSNWGGTPLLDISAGSAQSNHMINYISALIDENSVDGVFLDVVGSRLWSQSANFDSWSQSEKDRFRDGNIDFVRRVRALVQAKRPAFLVINNNTWVGNNGTAGEKYVNGICIEHHAPDAFWAAQAAKPYFGKYHRVLVIESATSHLSTWRSFPGVTNISSQTSSYAQVSPPPFGFTAQTDRLSGGTVNSAPPPPDETSTPPSTTAPRHYGQTVPGSLWSGGQVVDRKRAARVTVTSGGTLVSGSIFLDGNGGAAGTQLIRLALYSNNNGAPGALIATTSQFSVSSGSAGKWYSAPFNARPLPAGTYWIAEHTGGTPGVSRNNGTTGTNYYMNADGYSDGAASTFGPGYGGSVTMTMHLTVR